MYGATTKVQRDVPWARLAIHKLAGKKAPRRIYRVSALSPPLEFGVHENNLDNLLRGIRERVFAVEGKLGLEKPPRPESGRVESELAPFAVEFDRLSPPTTPWSAEEFCSTYVGRRATVYREAAESLQRQPVRRADANSDSFLKAEKVPFYAKADPAPRLIHPRSPRYNVAVGVFLKKIEHMVYRQVDKVWQSRTILKGYNAQQVGRIMARKWSKFRRPVAIGLDASRFDQHVSTDALIWEHERYLGFFSPSLREELAELLRWQLSTKCTARCRDGRVKYRVDGMRFSGDMNTGMGNCLLMSAMVWCWCRRAGVKAQLANNGDDCVLIVEEGQLRQLDLCEMVKWFRSLGFTMKVEEPVRDLEKVEFCQTHPVFDGCDWVMVRKHRHATAKDCISIKPLDSASVFDKWRLSVGLAGLSLTGGIPCQQEFYVALARGARGEQLRGDPTLETGFMRLARGMERSYATPTPVARYSYWLAFGVTPDEQEALERVYRGLNLAYEAPKEEGIVVPLSELLL